jgi:hypothetical protein
VAAPPPPAAVAAQAAANGAPRHHPRLNACLSLVCACAVLFLCCLARWRLLW